ncbi:condensation protein [Streptomyces yaizuensis]|uniref:Condensation protein n=1 Tax=Streptomyces yaizuensis TaxID=2989713 RepID=A0ABQ5P7D2_9ACTN|nr:condensation protein [Streptomyces sp. YSPA8]GLF98507.1 condensation protein [Streptomyces sp. YSPA8]
MTSVAHPVRSRPAGRPALVPFPVVDEITRHCLREEEPESIHIEVRLPGRPDAARLRQAFTEALRRHPRAQVRQAPGPWYRRRYFWELTGEPDPGVAVVTAPAPEPGALERARERCLASAPPLAASPPVRLELVEDPERRSGSALFLTVNHTALDAPACLRVLATAAELYGGRGGSPAAPPVRTAPGGRAAALPGPSPWTPSARVARGTPSERRGNGLLVADLPVPHRPPGAAYTVNDQLLVATALMIARWNRERGAPPRPIRITMPVDDRSRGADMPIGNGTRLVEVPFTVAELASGGRGAMGELLLRTADRTRALKAAPSPPLGYGAALLTAPVVPVAWRSAVTRGLRWAAGPWTSTTLLSNIGRVPYALDFGDAGRADAVWFSAPARMPRGLNVMTASTAGRLHLALRWSKALLAREDGARLLELFGQCLDTTEAVAAGSGGAPEGGPG